MTDIVAIDFEASCLPRHGHSFPIEVGIAIRGDQVRSWLIYPDSGWQGWDWAQEAEALHGISRNHLLAHGRPASAVLAELTAAVGSNRLVADSSLDQYWLDTLAVAAGHETPLRIDHAGALIEQWRVSAEQVTHAQRRADAMQPQRHRAGADARWLSILLTELDMIASENRKPIATHARAA